MINWQGIKLSSILVRKMGLRKHDLVISLKMRNIVNKYACFHKFSLYHITKNVYYILYGRIIYELQWLRIEVIDVSVST